MLYGQLGMVSLAQFALSGVGGWVCLRLIHGFGVPFEVGLLLGGLFAGLVGLTVGLPALRMRGLYLALRGTTSIASETAAIVPASSASARDSPAARCCGCQAWIT